MDASEPSPPAVVVACVAENDPLWAKRVETLVISLRAFGGHWRAADVRVHVVDRLEPAVWRRVERLDVTCRRVRRFAAPYPHANKLRMLEQFAADPGGVLLALDCDVAVVGDLGPPHAEAIAGKAADRSPISPANWRKLLARFELPCPEVDLEMSSTGDRVPVPYLNSGVLVVPGAMAGVLADAWARFIGRVWAASAEQALLRRVAFFTDQLALCLALVATGLPVAPLDLGWNFPTHRPVHPRALELAGPIRILHYHDRVSAEGELLEPAATEVAPLVTRLNAELALYRTQ